VTFANYVDSKQGMTKPVQWFSQNIVFIAISFVSYIISQHKLLIEPLFCDLHSLKTNHFETLCLINNLVTLTSSFLQKNEFNKMTQNARLSQLSVKNYTFTLAHVAAPNHSFRQKTFDPKLLIFTTVLIKILNENKKLNIELKTVFSTLPAFQNY